ncbi:hypothetical protein DY000_02001811 [Brassica cretica]|uniref:Uncharacterized protein n=1 Tax=Brassica cretica TaxID=69181 RepID=A0ABQ7C8Y8_BRACR|nr:hypothetical protein DY000_02001811 [Brassica cretica]
MSFLTWPGVIGSESAIFFSGWDPRRDLRRLIIITPPLDLRYRVRPVEDELRIPGNAEEDAECEEEEEEEDAIVASRMEKTAVATSFSLSSHLTRTVVVGLAIDGFVPSFSPFKISEKWRLR